MLRGEGVIGVRFEAEVRNEVVRSALRHRELVPDRHDKDL